MSRDIEKLKVVREKEYVTCDQEIKTLDSHRTDVDNVFRWVKVILNTLGVDLYDPSLPWVYKVREDGSIATNAFWYIDDCRPIINTV